MLVSSLIFSILMSSDEIMEFFLALTGQYKQGTFYTFDILFYFIFYIFYFILRYYILSAACPVPDDLHDATLRVPSGCVWQVARQDGVLAQGFAQDQQGQPWLPGVRLDVLPLPQLPPATA